MKERPKIVCLCGSTRFPGVFLRAAYEESLAGRIVLSVGCFSNADPSNPVTVGLNKLTPEQKVALDELHKRKIDMADDILVLNSGQYIGDSTRSEVAYAIEHGKPVRWLEKPDKTPLPEAHGVKTNSPVGMWRCGRCGHYGVAMSGHPRDPEIGQVDVCQQCGHRQRFLGRSNIYDDAVWEWRGLPDGAKPATPSPIKTVQGTELVERCRATAGTFWCPACSSSLQWADDRPEKHQRFQCPACKRMSEYLGLGQEAGKECWIWRTVPTKPQVVELAEKRPALYYTVRVANNPDVRASRGYDARIMSPRQQGWKRFALRDSAEKWIVDSLNAPSDSGPQHYVIVKHVAKRKAGAK